MSRRLSLVLADAFERAAHDVAMAEQVHHHHNDPVPSWYDNLIYWCRGFFAGLVDDYRSTPLSARVCLAVRRALSHAHTRLHR